MNAENREGWYQDKSFFHRHFQKNAGYLPGMFWLVLQLFLEDEMEHPPKLAFSLTVLVLILLGTALAGCGQVPASSTLPDPGDILRKRLLR